MVQPVDNTTEDPYPGPHELSMAADKICSTQDQESLNICERCKNIDFNTIFNLVSAASSSFGVAVYLGELEEDAPCVACRFFYSMRCLPKKNEVPKVFHLFFLVFGTQGNTWAVSDAHPPGTYAPSRLLCVQPGRSVRGTIAPADWHWIILQSSSKAFFGSEIPKLSALPVDPTSVNYDLLQAWCEQCDVHHSTCGQATNIKANLNKHRTGTPIRCIDCHTREVVQVGDSDKFFALSYVWGMQPVPVLHLTKEVGSANSRRLLPTNLPKVVEDAMIVVSNLGQRYLWVDQYCIDQNDPVDRQAQITNMDRIYEGAYATIVAFSGADSSSGLPGVKDRSRKPYPRVPYPSDQPLTAVRPSIVTSSELWASSVWSTRGWTYQEAVLSRRLLLFTEYQVEFICSDSVWHECTLPGIPDPYARAEPVSPTSYRLPKPDLVEYIRPARGQDVSGHFPHALHRLRFLDYVEEYSRRSLTYPNDALNAISGLLSRVPVCTYWGIPVCSYSDYNTVLGQPTESGNDTADEDATRGLYHTTNYGRERFGQPPCNPRSPGDATVRFLSYLFWRPASGRLRRRDNFPSWSWLGWDGHITFRGGMIDGMVIEGKSEASIFIAKQVVSSNLPLPWRFGSSCHPLTPIYIFGFTTSSPLSFLQGINRVPNSHCSTTPHSSHSLQYWSEPQKERQVLVPLADHSQENHSEDATSIIPHLTNYLWVEGQVSRMSFESLTLIGRHNGHIFDLRSSYPPVNLDNTVQREIYLRTCDPQRGCDQEDIHQRIVTGEWDCLLLVSQVRVRTYNLNNPDCYYLILDRNCNVKNPEEEEDHYYVVGTMWLPIKVSYTDRQNGVRPWEDPKLRRRIKLG